MDRAAKFDVLSMKRGIFMDERGFGTRLSMKRCVFMDERGFWTELSMKIGLFVDKGTELMRLSMKRGIFVDERGFRQGVNFSGSHLTKEIILILRKMGNSGC